ncbi:SusC/RagA family TonB-linked outer membrane protein [Pedobacter sp. UBA4863]|uniref:SusC/RagA family TonB-linked outer membrane protein n=1 Tax=Pedobacter sp. UBA4863 TaxID=1947060 RepID=UPI0025EB66AE|nr:SusC/RagA family TonB-linked outer membrane protein [Pedobacter sp. UBA4863]
MGTNAYAQQITVKGKVVSSKENIPLPGVGIKEKNKSNATQTDNNGNFLITVDANATLVLSYIGYVTKEVKASSSLTVKLEEDISSLSEVVVSVPYGSQTKASFTGSATTLRAKDLEGKPRASFQESLQGNVAGLQSSQGSGQPGGGLNVRIRGIGSYSAGSSPLYVVDGVPVVDGATTVLAQTSNTLAGINSNDIENVTVLKDASATSIYGSRAANGVILITTKSGAAGKTKINASVQQGLNQITDKDRNRPLNTSEMTELLIEGVINNTTGALAGINDPTAAYNYLLTQGLKPDINTDWLDVITQTGKYAQYNVSAAGGTEKTSFFASGGYYKQDAVTKGQNYEKITARLRLKNQATDKLSLNLGFAPNFQKLSTIVGSGTGANPVRSLNRLVPWVAPYNADGTYGSTLYNPELQRLENVNDTRIYALLGDASAEYKFFDGFSAESKVGIDVSYADDYKYWSPLWVDGASVNGRGMHYTSTYVNWNITNLLKYRKQLNDFGLEATLGQEAQKITRKFVSTQGQNFAGQYLYNLSSTSTPFVAWSSSGESTLASYFLNTSFNYKQKYFLNLTGRTDGSSRFGKNVRYGKFGSVGLAWNMHKEDFMANVKFVDEFKLRSSYGINGNQHAEWYAVPGIYSTGAVYNGSPAYVLAQIQNDNLTWETNKPFDVGVDVAMFNQRLTFTLDYFNRVTGKLLMNAPISYTNGLGSQDQNIGSFRNTGLEFAINSHNIKSSSPAGFNWKTNFNISTIKNRIIELSGTDQIISGRYVRNKGGDFYEFYMPGWAGVNPANGEGLWYTDETKTATTNTYNSAGSFAQGSALPKFFGGLTNTFDYKKISLSFMLYFNVGGKIYDSWGTFTSNDASSGITDYGAIARVDYDNRWQKPGDNATSPKMVFRGSQTGLSGQHSSRFLYDGTYVRLRDITLSYELPINKKYLNNAQVYLRGNNLLTYTKDDRLRNDPEVFIGGQLDQNLPIARQLLLGLNITF